MIQWLQGEAGGLMIAVLGYVMREFSENQHTPERIIEKRGGRFVVRLALAVAAGVLALVMLPPDTPNYIRVGVLVFAGAATPEIVRVLISGGLARLNRTIRDK